MKDQDKKKMTKILGSPNPQIDSKNYHNGSFYM